MTSSLYLGLVTHARLRPRRHRLAYRIAQGLFDLDELPGLGRSLRLFGHNRPAPISFHDKDHGDGSGNLRGWVEGELAKAGLRGPWGAIQVLCMPRMLGFVFNPLSVYFCHDAGGDLGAVLYEVNNTFGDRHAYAMTVAPGAGPIRQRCGKAFYVSPFLPMDLGYRFTLAAPDATVSVEIAVDDVEGPVLHARFVGERRPLNDRALAGILAAFPLMTLKVVAGIHWEALKIWLSGVPFVPRRGDRRPNQGIGDEVGRRAT